jgi:hypothetical protein
MAKLDMSNLPGGLDTAKIAGLIVVGAIAFLAVGRRVFDGARITIGD